MKSLMEINQFKHGETVFDVFGHEWVVWGWEQPVGAFPAHREELKGKTIQLKDPGDLWFAYLLPQELIRHTDKVRRVPISDNIGHAIYDPDGKMTTLTGEYIVYVGNEIINKYYTFNEMPSRLPMRAMGTPVFVEVK
jgi:hypothetical protein